MSYNLLLYILSENKKDNGLMFDVIGNDGRSDVHFVCRYYRYIPVPVPFEFERLLSPLPALQPEFVWYKVPGTPPSNGVPGSGHFAHTTITSTASNFQLLDDHQ